MEGQQESFVSICDRFVIEPETAKPFLNVELPKEERDNNDAWDMGSGFEDVGGCRALWFALVLGDMLPYLALSGYNELVDAWTREFFKVLGPAWLASLLELLFQG